MQKATILKRATPIRPAKPLIRLGQIRHLWTQYCQSTMETYRQFEANLSAVGLCGAVGMPIYYFVWTDLFPQPYENLSLRLLGGFMCLLLAAKAYWPQALRPGAPLLWHAILIYALPFFFTYMLLMNDISAVWLVTWLCGLFMLVVAVNWVNLILFIFVGVSTAWATFTFVGGGQANTDRIYEQLPVFVFALITGTLFSYTRGAVRRERLDAMLTVSRGISRELNGPLRSITTSTVGLKQYLPVLAHTYDNARAHGLDVPEIPTAHRRALDHTVGRIQGDVQRANTIIGMLKTNSRDEDLRSLPTKVVSAADCVAAAIDRYPFSSDSERALVKWRREADFEVHAHEGMAVQVLMNLIKVSLLAVARAGKGEVTIDVETSGPHNRLIVRQTGSGFPERLLAHVFDEDSFLEVGSGTGAGLLFSKEAVEAVGGSLTCTSRPSSYTEFVITLPPVGMRGR